MKKKIRLLIALALVPAALGLTANTAKSAEFTFPYFGDPENPCTEEMMFYEGNAHFVINTSTNPDGSTHATFHMNTQGVTAEGIPSGDDYVVTEVTNEQNQADIGMAPTQTHSTHHLIINHTPNTPNDDLHEHIHYTTTWVNGVPSIHYQRNSVECK